MDSPVCDVVCCCDDVVSSINKASKPIGESYGYDINVWGMNGYLSINGRGNGDQKNRTKK
jgi:crotonobetainyl-CoA:carnitine CoA-transferase CaiB-like acyl-CoA transferase